MNIHIRPKRWLFAVIPGLLVVLAAVVVTLATVLPNAAIVRARQQSIGLLADANDPDGIEKAVGSLGIVFHLADGSWIAIRYIDQHVIGDFWSSAVALDSTGRWYESEEHFCGQFRIYRGQWDRTLELLQSTTATTAEKKWWLENCPLEPASWRELEESANLEAARDKLLKLGFRPLHHERRPKMVGPWPVQVETKFAVVERLLR